MPRYFFHLRKDNEFIEDEEGVDLPDLLAVGDEALQAAREIIAERVKLGQPIEEREFVVFDERGQHVAAIPLKAALRFE
jgi:hypothetical protein